jgi:hypothetical protein
MFRRRRGLLLRLLHLLMPLFLPLFLPWLLHHLPSLDLLWRTNLLTLFMTWLRLSRSLFALNLLRHLLPLHFSLHLLLCAPCYSLPLCLLSLLLSLRLLRRALRPQLVYLLRSLFALKLAYLLPRVLVAPRRLGSKLCDSLSAGGVLLVASRIRLDRSLVPATSVIYLPLISKVQLLTLRFIRNLFHAQRSGQILSERQRRRRDTANHRRLVKLLCNAWRQVDLAATPRRMDRCVSEWGQREWIEDGSYPCERSRINSHHSSRFDHVGEVLYRHHRDCARHIQIDHLLGNVRARQVMGLPVVVVISRHIWLARGEWHPADLVRLV